AAITVLEVDGGHTGGELRRFGRRSLDVVGVHEIEIRRRRQVGCRPAERRFPCRVHPPEAAVEPGDAQQVDRHREKSIELLLAALERLGPGAYARLETLMSGADACRHDVEGRGQPSDLVPTAERNALPVVPRYDRRTGRGD